MIHIREYLKNEPSLIPAVVAFCIDKNRVLLTIRKTSHTNLGVNKKAGYGGKIEPNETKEECLIRELKEEAEIDVVKFEEKGLVTFLNPLNPKWDMRVWVFVVSKWYGEIKETKSNKPVWYNTNEIPVKEMFSDNKYWLYQVLNGLKVEATFLFDDSDVVESEIKFCE